MDKTPPPSFGDLAKDGFETVTGVLSAPLDYVGGLAWDTMTNFTRPGMEAGTPTMQSAYMDDSKEVQLVNGRYGRAGKEVRAYVDETGKMMASQAIGLAMGAVGHGGGMLGNAETQALEKKIAQRLKAKSWKVTHGAGEMQECLKDVGATGSGKRGRPKGTVFPDITAQRNGKKLRIQTVDTNSKGQPTRRERRNLKRIRDRSAPGDHTIWIPKKPRK